MTLTRKTLLVLAGVFVLTTALNYGVLRALIFPSYVELEQTEAERNHRRTVDAFRNELEHLSTFVFDWAAWDDSYAFIRDRNKDFVESNLPVSSFATNKLNLVMFVGSAGKVVWSRFYDLKKAEWTDIKTFAVERVDPSHPLLTHGGNLKSAPAGIVVTEKGPMMVASRPILTSNQKGPIRGTLIMGFFLNDRLKKIRKQVNVEFTLWAIAGGAIPAADRAALDHLVPGHPMWTGEQEGTTRSIYGTLPDVAGKPALLLRADTPRQITAIGAQTLALANIGVALAGVCALVLLAFLFRGLITGPLTRMTDHVLSIGTSADLSKRLTIERQDEIGILAREFDQMLGALADARGQLLDQSFQAGVAEVASDVLHNVRNQISPMVLRLDRLRQLLPPPGDGKIETALTELAADDIDGARKGKLVGYLKLATDNLTSRQTNLRAEVDVISRQLGRVEEVVSQQDRFSYASRVIEDVKLSDAVKRAVGMLPEALGEDITIVVDPAVEAFVPVRAQGFVLTHVIQNLITNAAESIRRGGAGDGTIEITVHDDPSAGGAPKADLQVRDNGAGIDPDKIASVFERGFSTKEGTTRGTGLHWCANSLAGMNGRIFAESDGVDKGAVFHVLLPMSSQAIETAAYTQSRA